MLSLLKIPPLALYVHFPWCVRKCPYCDFNSHAIKGPLPERRYVELLLRDFEREAARLRPRPIETIFLGGGTPSLFSPDFVDVLLSGVRRLAAVPDGAEVTLEANPGTIERGRFAEYRAAGVNRVSLGAQSFNSLHLRALGRIHSADETRRAVDELKSAGIENFNLDLMYGLPEQTVAQSIADLEAGLALDPTHLSHYQLTLEPGTAFFHASPALPTDEVSWGMQVACQTLLAARGFVQYEVSAYARTRHECRHNRNYWDFGDYVGVGAGAHGKLTLADAGRIVRTDRPRGPREYMNWIERGVPNSDTQISVAQLPFEFMLNALRLKSGFTRASYEARTGLSMDALQEQLGSAERRELLQCDESGAWRCSDLGYRFLNDLLQIFLFAEPPAIADSYAQDSTMAPAAVRCD
jgi:oxygen-independent coproporphyrinogen-3 oxidase